jgi:hypothetical protein
VSAVGFDLHAATASKTLLAAPELAVDKFLIHCQPGGQSGKKRDQCFAMGLSGGEVAKHVEEAL